MIIAYGFIKLSIVFFYRRLFLVLRWSAFDIISLAYIVILIIWAVTSFFLFLFICNSKIYLQWGPLSDAQDQCGDFVAVELGLVISDLVTDAMILTLPMPIVCLSLTSIRTVFTDDAKSVKILIFAKSDLAAESTLVSQTED
jgi:hypothetical protein